MSDINEEKLAEELEITALEFEADDNGIITAFSDIGLAGGSDGAPSAGGSKDILATPGYGNTLNQISQLDFKFVKASAPSDLAEPQDGEIKVSLYPYGERKSGDAYDSPVLVIGGTWNGVRYAPHVDYISGSSSQVAPIWIHPRSGKIEATVFSAPAGGFNNLTLTANADGFLISGGTTSRTFTVTGGNLTLTSGSNNPNVTIPNTATATAIVNTSSFTQYGVVFSSSATNGIVSSTAQGASGQPLVGAGASNPVFGNINIASYVTGILGVGNGGTGTSTAFTAGSIVFAGASGIYAQDNANFFWDDTNNTFGIGTTRTGAISGTNPSMRILGTGATSSTSAFEVQDSATNTIFFVRNDGFVGIGTNAPTSPFYATYTLSTDASLTLHTNSLTVTSAESGRNIRTMFNQMTLNTSGAISPSGSAIMPNVWNQLVVASTHTGAITTPSYGLNNEIQFSQTGSTTHTLISGIRSHYNINTGAAGTITTADNFISTLQSGTASTTTITTFTHYNTSYSLSGSPVIGTLTGLDIKDPGAGTVTTQYGIRVRDQSRGSTNYALYFDGTSGLARQGVWWNGDTNLYRSAADTLKTDDSLVVGANLSVLNAGTFSLYESGSVNFSSFVAGTQANDLRYTLPTSQPTTNQVLTATSVTGSGPYDIALGWVSNSTDMAIGGAVTSGTVGSVLFVGAGSTLAQDNSNFFWDDTNNYLGLGASASPGARLHIAGNQTATAWTNNGIGLRIDSATYTDSTSSGTVALNVAHRVSQPTFAASSSTTYTDAVSLFIKDSPSSGANVSITRGWAVYVESGAAYLGPNVSVGASTSQTAALTIGGNRTATAWGTSGLIFRTLGATLTDSSSSGTVASVVVNSLAQSTLAASSSTTYTDAATLYITNAPTAGSNVSITNAYAIWVDNGISRFDGSVQVQTLSSGRVTYAGTNGLLQDSANMTFDGNRLALATTGNTGGLLIGGDTNLYRSAADVLKTDDAFQALSFNKVTITAPATAATLTIADGATLTVSASATIQNGNHSNTNTGDETATTIHNKVGYTQSFLLMGA